MSEEAKTPQAKVALILELARELRGLELVRSACGLPGDGLTSVEIEVLRHVPGRRATIEYRFSELANAPKVIGKVYRSVRRAARIHAWYTALEEEVFPQTGPTRVPSTLGLLRPLHMLLYTHINGTDLRHWLDSSEPVSLAAAWLARLHSGPPLRDLKIRTVEQEIEKSLHWISTVQRSVSPATQRLLSTARDRLAEYLIHPPEVELCTIHHDYYYGNLLWDGAHLWAIDFDQLRIGDPALDVAHFLRHLEVLAYRQTHDFGSYAAQGELFLSTYKSERPTAAIETRLPLYRAHTLLKLAATEVERARDGWLELTETLSTRACLEIDQLE